MIFLTGDLVDLERTRQARLDFILAAESHPDNAPYVFQSSRQEHISMMENPDYLHLTGLDKSGEPVGYMILRGLQNPMGSVDLMRLVAAVKGRGYGKSMLKMAMAYSFHTLKAHRLSLDVVEDNQRAMDLYRRCGFIEEGVLRQYMRCESGYKSMVLFSILEDEYRKSLCDT